MATTPLQLWTAINDRLNTLSAWWASANAYLNRRPPNGAAPPYVVASIKLVSVDQESDGVALQTFSVEFVGRTVGPDDAATVDAELPLLDGSASDPTGGIELDDPEKVVGVLPTAGQFRTLADLKDGGKDQYAPGRAWTILVASKIGA